MGVMVKVRVRVPPPPPTVFVGRARKHASVSFAFFFWHPCVSAQWVPTFSATDRVLQIKAWYGLSKIAPSNRPGWE